MPNQAVNRQIALALTTLIFNLLLTMKIKSPKGKMDNGAIKKSLLLMMRTRQLNMREKKGRKSPKIWL